MGLHATMVEPFRLPRGFLEQGLCGREFAGLHEGDGEIGQELEPLGVLAHQGVGASEQLDRGRHVLPSERLRTRRCEPCGGPCSHLVGVVR